MTLSRKKLAELLDDWLSQGRAIITETDTQVVVAQLSSQDALSLVADLERLEWEYEVEDDTSSAVTKDSIEADFAPYRIKSTKPAAPVGRSRVLTNAGLIDWLSRPSTTSILEVARLSGEFQTFGVLFTYWDSTAVFVAEPLDADPRKVVRENNSVRTVAADLSRFILKPGQTIDLGDPASLCFANLSVTNIAISLCNEFEAPETIVFKGPPSARYILSNEMASAIGNAAFAALQESAHWVFGFSKEMEIRHILLTAELSRSTPGGEDASCLLMTASAPALEGARIAYELGLHKISADSLKALADLRKAISDEAAKLGDSTRQLAGAVTGALFGGIGLIVVRLTLATSSTSVAAATLLIGIVLCLYVAVTIISGKQFVAIQRDLRKQWRNRLYRFLPEAEYEKMVTDPANKAERAFDIASWISGVLAVVLFIAVIIVSAPELWQSYQAWQAQPAITMGK